MTESVPASEIETLVGARRLNSQHLARADSREQMVYILHARQCVNHFDDPRECPLSKALDRGIDHLDWLGWEDRPVQVIVREGKLVPRALPRGVALVSADADRSAEPPEAP